MSLEMVGQKLKEAREAKSLSARQVYERTKIPLALIESLEEGRSDELPEPVYVAGFIRLYAQCVGLNAQVLSEQYRAEAEKEQDARESRWNKQIASEPIFSSPEYVKKNKIRQDPPMFKTIYFNVLMIFLVVGLLAFIFKTQQQNMLNQPDPSLLPLQQAALKYKVDQQQSADGATNPDSRGDAYQGDTRVSMSANQHVWLDVTALSSGESLFTGYLEQGDRRDFQDSKGVKVRAGNGGSLTVDYRGKIETLGKAGQVAERSFLSKAALASEAEDVSTRSEIPVVNRPSRPQPNTSKTIAKRRPTQDRDYRRVDEVHSRQYIPGESLGGGRRSIDVPYRFSEGRLDVD